MIGSGRTRARIEQTVGNICEISIGLRAAKDPGRSNALPEGAILIHRGHGHDVIVVVVGILDPGKLLLFQIVQASDGLRFLLRTTSNSISVKASRPGWAF